MRLDGAWTAIATPMNLDTTLDWEGLEKNIEFQISQGITGVVPVGTTGESPTVTWDEHNEVIDRVLSRCGARCGVLAGTGSNSTEEAIESTRHAVRSGAKAVLMVDCYYNGPSSQELRDDYYAAVAAEFPDTTIVPYVIPGRSGTALCVEDLAILASRYQNVNTVKEATGDLARMARTRELLGDDFSIMSGDDDITYAMLTDPAIRANGVISVASNVVPGGVCRMVAAAVSGDVENAARMRDELAPLLGIITVKVDNPRVLPGGKSVIVNDRYRNPLPVKTLMAGLGMPAGPCRRPLGKMSKAGVEVVRSAAQTVWDRNPEILRPIGDFFGIDAAARLADDAIWNALAL
ncbi:MAG: 4-hydroxy-tetrahydrodipicolinate synthase [Armatimonadetes bacterium RBG_16_58_9]|nr:MAG: 4-hydroxy-tetrahydrodipicolinate synthase [Armatimonadetes bacterium RBG_16_58_9]